MRDTKSHRKGPKAATKGGILLWRNRPSIGTSIRCCWASDDVQLYAGGRCKDPCACASTARRCSSAAGPIPHFAAPGARISIMSIRAGGKIRDRTVRKMDENMALTPYETREILFYKTDNGDVKVEILLYQENLWLTQAKMAELFEVQKAAISKHLKNIFTSGELMEDSVVSVFWKQLRRTGKIIPQNIIIWMLSLQSVTGLIPKRRPCSASGRTGY